MVALLSDPLGTDGFVTIAIPIHDALGLVRTARELLTSGSAAAAAEVRNVVRSLDALGCDREARERASLCLHRWARELMDGNSTTAGIYLDRASLALGVRPSQVHGEPPEPALLQPVSADGLSAEEQDLFASLPPARAPLEGAAALAQCWGGRMSPTSARGRYSRLATKLRGHHGREMLLRGRGRYGRADD